MTHVDLVLVLLTACVALQVLAARFAVPHPSLLVLGGAAIALVPGLPRPGLDLGVILLIFVPPLLYRASVRAPLREFRRQCWPIFQLSIPLVLVTMGAVALVAHGFAQGLGPQDYDSRVAERGRKAGRPNASRVAGESSRMVSSAAGIR